MNNVTDSVKNQVRLFHNDPTLYDIAVSLLTTVGDPRINTDILGLGRHCDDLGIGFGAFTDQFRVKVPESVTVIHHPDSPIDFGSPTDCGPPIQISSRVGPEFIER